MPSFLEMCAPEALMKRCLIADQSEVVRKIARHYLEALSCEVVEARNAEEALHIIRTQNISAVLLDWRLPGQTTIEFLSTLRFSGIQHRPLVIYITTENDPADIRKAFAAGAHTYLLKPFDRASFTETMRNAALAPVTVGGPNATSAAAGYAHGDVHMAAPTPSMQP
jgi:two-component system, chemotaxis family, chemotaxis protein CheY